MYINIYIYYFPILFPFRLVQNTDFPVLYSKSLLVIYFKYSSMYISIPHSQSTSHPSPMVTINSFSTSLGLFYK